MAIGLGLLLVVLFVAAAETIPRLFPQWMPAKVRSVQRLYEARNSWESMMQGDSRLGFALRPDLDMKFPSEGREIDIRTVEIGSSGIGRRDIGIPGPYKAIALGDSFTFCDDAPVQECWVRKLSETFGQPMATLGMNGYSNLAEARLLADVGAEFQPDLVLVSFFANDFKDNVHFRNWAAEGGSDDYWTWMRRKRRSDASETLAQHSILYRLFDAARRYGKRETYEHNDGRLNFTFRADGWFRAVLSLPGQTPGYELATEALRDMQNSADKLGARLVVLLFPFKEQVYWDIARQYTRDGDSLDESTIDAPMGAVRDFLTREGIELCDLTDDLRAAAADGPQLYLKVSAHWTAAGNAAAADSIARCLRRKGLVPSDWGETAN